MTALLLSVHRALSLFLSLSSLELPGHGGTGTVAEPARGVPLSGTGCVATSGSLRVRRYLAWPVLDSRLLAPMLPVACACFIRRGRCGAACAPVPAARACVGCPGCGGWTRPWTLLPVAVDRHRHGDDRRDGPLWQPEAGKPTPSPKAARAPGQRAVVDQGKPEQPAPPPSHRRSWPLHWHVAEDPSASSWPCAVPG